MTHLVTWKGLTHIREQASIFGPACLVYKRIIVEREAQNVS